MELTAAPPEGVSGERFDPREVDAIVVGAGHNGLTAGCYLAREGMDVLVVESSPGVGGMTSTTETLPEAPGHRFNEGAIQLTGVFRLSQIARELDLPAYGLREIPVEPAHIQLAPDGSSLAIWRDAERTARELERFSKRDARAWREMSSRLAAVMPTVLAYMRSHPTRVLSVELIRALAGTARRPGKLMPILHMLTASHSEYLEETFETELPKGALAAMAAFSQMRLDLTAWAMIYLGVVQRASNSMPVGGTGALPAALHRCLADHGGRVRTSSPVEEIVVRRGRAVGVSLASGEELRARRGVLTSCNAKLALTTLLPEGALPDDLRRRAEDIPVTKTSATSLKINVAVGGKLSMPRHRAWRADGLDPCAALAAWHTCAEQVEGWDEVVRGEWPDPVPISCVIAPSAVDPTQAPEGRDNLWLWSGVVPVDPRVPWEEVRDRIGDRVLADCSAYYEGLEEMEIGREVLGGPDIEERFNAPAGNVYHVDPLATRFGPLKPALGLGGYRTPVDGLYLSGAGTHPTGGVCALPGKLAAQTLIRESGGRTARRRIRSAAG